MAVILTAKCDNTVSHGRSIGQWGLKWSVPYNFIHPSIYSSLRIWCLKQDSVKDKEVKISVFIQCPDFQTVKKTISVNPLSKFLLMGGAVFPPCCLPWGQTMVEIMKIMVTSFRRSHAGTTALSAPNPAAGHHWPTPPLETPGHSGQVWISLLWGYCSFFLGPSVQKVLSVPSESLFPSPV